MITHVYFSASTLAVFLRSSLSPRPDDLGFKQLSRVSANVMVHEKTCMIPIFEYTCLVFDFLYIRFLYLDFVFLILSGSVARLVLFLFDILLLSMCFFTYILFMKFRLENNCLS